MVKKSEEEIQEEKKKEEKGQRIQQQKLRLKALKKESQPSQRFLSHLFFQEYGYKIVKQIGGGSFGIVYQAVSTGEEKQEYAIKANFHNVNRKLIFAQVSFLYLVKRKTNLPILHKVFMHEENPFIVVNYFEARPFVTYFFHFTMQEIKHYIIELLKGLKNLKDLGIFHRDIKPGNFLYNHRKKQGVIIDFGLSEVDKEYVKELYQDLFQTSKQNKIQYEKKKENLNIYENIMRCLDVIGYNKIGTQIYSPLEALLKQYDQSYSCDIWSVGIIMLQFLLRKHTVFENIEFEFKIDKKYTKKDQFIINFLVQLAIFFGEKVVDACESIGYDLQLPDKLERVQIKDICRVDGYDEVTEDFLYKLLKINHKERIHVEDALMHPFLDSVRDEHMRCHFWKNFMRQYLKKKKQKLQQKMREEIEEKKKQVPDGSQTNKGRVQGRKQDVEMQEQK